MISDIDPDLLKRISLGEDSTFELKEMLKDRDSDRESMAQEIVAFANSQGGIILIGVNDKGVVVGVPDIDKTEKIVVKIANDSIQPPVDIFTKKLLCEGHTVLQLEVRRGLHVHNTQGRYYERQGSSKRIISSERLSRLMQSRSQARVISFDEQPVPGTGKESLHAPLYQRFIRPDVTDESEDSLLLKRDILVSDGDSSVASVTGVLMCNRQSERYLRSSYICAVCYRGISQDANYQIDAQDFKGPLDQQIRDAYAFVSKHNVTAASKNIGREDHPHYSMRAVFEALVNAVVHRDYAIYGSKIRLFLFSDRLELYSPGALPNTITVEKLPHRQNTRNELIAQLLSELDIEDSNGMEQTIGRRRFLERRGEGVTIILRESTELSGKRPEYVMHDEELCLTIYAATHAD